MSPANNTAQRFVLRLLLEICMGLTELEITPVLVYVLKMLSVEKGSTF